MSNNKLSPAPRRRSLHMPRGFYPLLDAALVFVSFAIAYYVRYELQIISPVQEFNRAPFAPYSCRNWKLRTEPSLKMSYQPP